MHHHDHTIPTQISEQVQIFSYTPGRLAHDLKAGAATPLSRRLSLVYSVNSNRKRQVRQSVVPNGLVRDLTLAGTIYSFGSPDG